jgi:type IV pilus assembly protein PilA
VRSSNLVRFTNDPRVKKALTTKPWESGFSLIELVVVIAVLAILSAVALPNFLGVQKDGQVATAKNTLATIVKECVTNDLRGTGTSFLSVQSAIGKLNGYTLSNISGTNSCFAARAIGDGTLVDYSITYTQNTGVTVKNCSAKTASDYFAGCFASDGLLTTISTAVTGSW